VARPVSVRLDDDALRALRVLEASGMSRSDAVRTSLVAAAERLRWPASLAAEAADLEADEADRREMQEIAAFMEQLRAAEFSV
jgi:antitoxin component of RelBE/YafQ-DinJ toxin-antitoxin module